MAMAVDMPVCKIGGCEVLRGSFEMPWHQTPDVWAEVRLGQYDGPPDAVNDVAVVVLGTEWRSPGARVRVQSRYGMNATLDIAEDNPPFGLGDVVRLTGGGAPMSGL